MGRKQNGVGMVSIGEGFSVLSCPLKAILKASRRALHRFTRFEQTEPIAAPAKRTPISASCSG